MANYDRRILVPYLQDVCSVEMLCSTLVRQINSCENSIRELNTQINQKIYEPQKPNYESYRRDEVGGFVYLIFGLIPLLLVIWIFSAAGWEAIFFEIILIIPAGFFLFLATLEFLSSGHEQERDYRNALNAYEQRKREVAQIKSEIPVKKKKLQNQYDNLKTLNIKFNKAHKLRSDLYSVNIIPAKYRNIYAAYYLYDYFNSSRETDLDKIIQTLLLDEIKQRLDKVIVQNERILLNQRVQLAYQHKQNTLIANQHQEQMRKIAQMERNQELQMDYQKMIIKNQEVTNFFLADEYFRRF